MEIDRTDQDFIKLIKLFVCSYYTYCNLNSYYQQAYHRPVIEN